MDREREGGERKQGLMQRKKERRDMVKESKREMIQRKNKIARWRNGER